MLPADSFAVRRARHDVRLRGGLWAGTIKLQAREQEENYQFLGRESNPGL
jgi:hypothetical protein